MAHQWFQKPENALKRALELINMENSLSVQKRQKTSALEILHDTLTSKKNKTWQIIHQEIMMVYIDICIELQLVRIAKDGLHQYRNLALSQNPSSLEFVLKHFITACETSAKKAKLAACADELIVDDLDATETPEAMLLSTTTSESNRDRANRQLVVPHLRFLWEAYRTVLDILKLNTQLEGLYHEIASKAFDFCLRYTRKIEFRRLCEMMRTHFNVVQKNSSDSQRLLKAWEGWSQESVELHLKLRYEQLEAAVQLEHWTEGFRTIEDIHAVMSIMNCTPKVALMATYYEKLTQIFWVSDNYLFHAYASFKFYSLTKNVDSQLTKEQMTNLSSAVLLASLSIPIMEDGQELSTSINPDGTVDNEVTNGHDSLQMEKTQRMASLLGFTASPKRSGILQILIDQENILDVVLPEVAQLFQHLEIKFHPLQVVSMVKPLLEKLRMTKDLAKYVPALERLLVQRLLSQLTKVYSSVTISHFQQLLEGLSVTFHDVEQLIVRSVQKGHFSVRIDHRNGCLRFNDFNVESKEMRLQLTNFGKRLESCLLAIRGQDNDNKVCKTFYEMTKKTLDQDQERMLDRQAIIEERKEVIEKLQMEKAQCQEKLKEEMDSKRREIEQKRLAEESERRERERRQRIRDEIALKETKQMLDRLGKNTENMDVKDLASIDREKVIREAKEEAKKAKEEAQRKLKEQAKRLDYIVRATREAELPILQKAFAAQQIQDKQAFEQRVKDTREASKLAYEKALQEKARFDKFSGVASKFVEMHKQRSEQDFCKQQRTEQEQRVLNHLEDRIQRAKDRHAEEEERIAWELEEEQRKEREETERQAREAEMEKRLAKEAEHEAERKAAQEERDANASARDDSGTDTPQERNFGFGKHDSSRADTPQEHNYGFGRRDNSRTDTPQERNFGFGKHDNSRFDTPQKRNYDFNKRDNSRTDTPQKRNYGFVKRDVSSSSRRDDDRSFGKGGDSTSRDSQAAPALAWRSSKRVDTLGDPGQSGKTYGSSNEDNGYRQGGGENRYSSRPGANDRFPEPAGGSRFGSRPGANGRFPEPAGGSRYGSRPDGSDRYSVREGDNRSDRREYDNRFPRRNESSSSGNASGGADKKNWR